MSGGKTSSAVIPPCSLETVQSSNQQDIMHPWPPPYRRPAAASRGLFFIIDDVPSACGMHMRSIRNRALRQLARWDLQASTGVVMHAPTACIHGRVTLLP